MSRRSDLIDRGAFERALSLLGRIGRPRGNRPPAEIRPDNASVEGVRDRLRSEFRTRDGWDNRALDQIIDSARLSVNAARRWTDPSPSSQVPPLGRLPCPEAPDGRCDGRYQVTGYVEVIDPTTGGRTRVPFVVRSEDRPTRAQIENLALNAALGSAGWRSYDQTGSINPSSARVGTLVITSISGRE